MAEINNRMCGGGALVDLHDLAFELVTRTELHYFSPSRAPPFFSTAIGASFNKMRCHPCRKALFIEPPRSLCWKPVARDAGEFLCDLNAALTTGVPPVPAGLMPPLVQRGQVAHFGRTNPVRLAGILPPL